MGSLLVLFFGPCIFIIEERTDQGNAQINFSLEHFLFTNWHTQRWKRRVIKTF